MRFFRSNKSDSERPADSQGADILRALEAAGIEITDSVREAAARGNVIAKVVDATGENAEEELISHGFAIVCAVITRSIISGNHEMNAKLAGMMEAVGRVTPGVLDVILKAVVVATASSDPDEPHPSPREVLEFAASKAPDADEWAEQLRTAQLEAAVFGGESPDFPPFPDES